MIINIFIVLISPVMAADLKFVAILYRHGDRTPIASYPLDPWQNASIWSVEPGELTNLGKAQHYALGKWLRKRYSRYISDQFDPSEVYIQSTDIDRTLMSAQANLAGMYPPIKSSVWNPDLNWQPIPVHTIDINEDAVLSMMKPCPAYDEEMKRYNHSKEYLDIVERYKPLMKYLTNHTGKKIDNIRNTFYIYDLLFIENLYNLSLPEWTKPVFPEKLLEASVHRFVTPTATALLKRLCVGPWIKEVTSLMEKATKPKNKLKMKIYSAHDVTVASILHSLDMFNFMLPPYTSTLFFELFSDHKTNDYFLRILYRNSSDIVQPHVMQIPNCGETCSLEKFKQIYSHLLDVDWDRECKQQSSSLCSLTVAIVTCLAIGFILIFYIARSFCMTRPTLKEERQMGRLGPPFNCNCIQGQLFVYQNHVFYLSIGTTFTMRDIYKEINLESSEKKSFLGVALIIKVVLWISRHEEY